MAAVRTLALSLSSLVTLSLVASGCIPDDGGAESSQPGGAVWLTSYDYFGSPYDSASAFFIAYLDTSNGAELSSYQDGFPVKNGCVITDVEGAETPVPTPMPVGLDVGSSITAGNGTLEISMSQNGTGSYAASSITIERGSSYSLELPGSTDVEQTMWENALSVPALLEIDQMVDGNLTLATGSSGSVITWSSVGADSVIMYFYGNKSGFCQTGDSGSFTIPTDFLAEAGTSGYFSALALNENAETLNGRRVWLMGGAGPTGYYGSGSPAAR